MADQYPGYNVDPKVRKVIDRCIRIGLIDFHKPYSNTPKLFKFSTLEKDLCIPSKLKGKDVTTGLPGIKKFKGAITLKAKAKEVRGNGGNSA
jgi:hypothetical protein